MAFIKNKKQLVSSATILGVAALGASFLNGTSTAHAQAPQVTVDRSPVVFNGQPPVEEGGRVLVPLRGVLEKLGAFVDFNSRSQTVTALRGATNITLPIGSRQALINNKSVSLDVPARVVNGSTLVPLRFVAEALGAQVTFDVGTNTVAIVSGANGAGGTPIAENPPPVADQQSVTGTVTALFTDVSPRRIVLRVRDRDRNDGDAKEQTIPVKADAKITIVRQGAADPVIQLRRINVGDEVAVLQNGEGQAIAISVTARKGSPQNPPKNPPPAQTSGTLKGEFLESTKRDNVYTLKMTDGRTIVVADDVPVVYQNQKIGVDDLRSGDNVTIAINPNNKRGTRIVVSDN